ncbi:LemA family protein [Paenibacillus swuensis]|uniref:LemA family protein n=1 Tax=Paenibacillus swuensis TaxID=1178515 RepID=A0A172TGP5_9BACL|nr:LemA family protein [Paenibacillus swuensis]ANE46211.1 LemA family protein [Paenibacillus swuensis]
MKNKAIWIVLAVVVVLGLLFVTKYNSLVNAEENVNNKWAQVDNQLKRRADLIPNLVETVKGYAKQELEAIKLVTDARAKLAGARTPGEAADANNELSGALSRLLVITENYPNLKSDQNFRQLSDELAGTENRLAVARKDYNDEVTVFNKDIRRFPGSLIAGILGFEKKEYFEVSEAEREVPKVDFGS